ncbi:hypothetical protein EIP91_005463 [Steccherinum ochraceum]|uniref:F-box domain-containing protein n=1 Tax=Steccherinum ochraceum TaxID=92696 RepID=A0A4V2MXW3_9APHY|nr:hypothetical protein EIP91_005463 [Steccherinum ochraceum]
MFLPRFDYWRGSLSRRPSSVLNIRSTCDSDGKQPENSIPDQLQIVLEQRRRLNTLTDISQLPTELLLKIFSFCVDFDLYEKSSEDHMLKTPYRWSCITHVCHHWRDVALHDPQLWSHVSFTADSHYNAVPAFLYRSRDLLLTLEVAETEDFAYDPAVEAVQGILSQVHRARALHFRVSRAAWVDLVPEESETSVIQAPHLTSVRMHELHRYNSKLPRFFTDILDAPNLQELVLSGYLISWASPFIRRPGLTKLAVLASSLDGTLSTMLDAIKAMPRLKHLELKISTFTSEIRYHPRTAEPEVNLPDLTYLSIDMQTRCTTTIVQALVLSPAATLIIEPEVFWDDDDVDRDIYDLLDILAEKFKQYGHPFHGLAVGTLLSTRPLLVNFYREAPPDLQSYSRQERLARFFGESTSSTTTSPLVRVRLPSRTGVLDNTLSTFPFPSFNVDTVLICNILQGTVKILRETPQVSTLRLVGPILFVKQLLVILESRAEGDGGTSGWFLPRLRVVEIERMRFEPTGLSGYGGALIDAINARRGSGCGIERLVIKDCVGLFAEDIQTMRSSIRGCEVVWDGNVLFQPKYGVEGEEP